MAVDLSVIIVNYNTEAFTLNCIESIILYSQNVDYEVIVVDNGSSPGSFGNQIIKNEQVRLIRNSQNLGFSAGNNTGARLASGKYLLFLNPDTLFINNCLVQFRDFLDDQPAETASCGGYLLTESYDPAASWGNLPSLMEQVAGLGFRRFFPKYFYKRLALSCPGNAKQKEKVPYIIGADICIRKTVFEEVGGFDERYFLYYEDADLYKRLNQKGYHSWVLPGPQIIHYGSRSTIETGNFNYNKYKWLEKSKYLYFNIYHGKMISFLTRIVQLINMIIHYPFSKSRYKLMKVLALTMKA